MINFCFDEIINSKSNIVYPNLSAKLEGEFNDVCGDFSTTYPYSDPPRLLSYLSDEHIDFKIHNSSNCPVDSFYFINVNFFDHSVDWFSRMSSSTLKNAQENKFKILFYYCEGDSPERIRNTLYEYANKHSISTLQIHFISHTTIAKQVRNFYYINDDEILFKNAQNYSNSQSTWHNNPRSKKFTCLIRSHKNWRYIVGAKFNELGVYDSCYGSYNQINMSDGFDHTDDFINGENNPLDGLVNENEIDNFNRLVPFSPDTLSDDEHNDYETFVDYFYSDAYWNIVCETHLNLDDTNGTFITEKTWKPIRHNQPFIIVGTIGSLDHLHSLGYKTFDGIIDESYDYTKDDASRFNKICNVISDLNSKTLKELNYINDATMDIVAHNSELFNSSKLNRLTSLINELQSSE
jgi:hypothetical protein